MLWEIMERAGFRHKLEATECLQVLASTAGDFRWQRPSAQYNFPKACRSLPSKKLCLQSFPSPFLKAFPSTASNPAHVESELKKTAENTFYMSAAAATDTAPKSNPSFLEKEMKQKQQQGRAMCLLPGLPAAVTQKCLALSKAAIQSHLPLSSVHSVSCSAPVLMHSAPSCSWGNSHRLFSKMEQSACSHFFRCCFWTNFLLSPLSFIKLTFVCLSWAHLVSLLMDSDLGRARAPGLEEPLSISPQPLCIQGPIWISKCGIVLLYSRFDLQNYEYFIDW